jgi:hypothetical protein
MGACNESLHVQTGRPGTRQVGLVSIETVETDRPDVEIDRPRVETGGLMVIKGRPGMTVAKTYG